MTHEPIGIRQLTGTPPPAWNVFVEAHPHGSVFHCAEWAAVYAELPWIEPCYLEAHRAGMLVGIMPLAEVRCGLGRRALVSAPYCVEAGALASDAPAQRALEEAACALARSRNVAFLEVRQTCGHHPQWPVSQAFCGFARTLAPSSAENFAAIPRKQRAMVRKGEAAGLVAQPSDDLDLFYRLYSESVRNLGTPVYARRLFEALVRHLGERVSLFTVQHAGASVAVVMSFWFKGRVMPYYAGARAHARALKAYDFMYWQLMQAALARGCTVFDFGRSLRDSGAYAFKKNWGFTARPLTYQLLSMEGGEAALLDPDAPFNRLARRAWSRLPLPLANWLGPWLSRRLY